ncbi:hypothetical protein F383_09175 [Gossypium arboreum]|uniref:Uncharacterized protein n=1 Tax=Gossypium arboreum TaxID=29729 RepID=A0A0B0NMR8_GOSAR|nr:hypothetical protein F383_09175 [Gossypium arboreum]
MVFIPPNRFPTVEIIGVMNMVVGDVKPEHLFHQQL